MARPVGLEPATLGLEGRVWTEARNMGLNRQRMWADRLYLDGYILLSADCPHPPISFEKQHMSVCPDRSPITDREHRRA